VPLESFHKKINVNNKRFTFDDINTMTTNFKWFLLQIKGHTHDEGLLRFNPSLRATLGAGGSNECEGGQLMDGVTKECTTLPTFCCNLDKRITYNVWSPSRLNM
jgi:hypothetical protein